MRPDLSWLQSADDADREAKVYEALAQQKRDTAANYRKLAASWADEHGVTNTFSARAAKHG